MYKKITHTIVEEHFDSTEDAKANMWRVVRYYPDGEQISSNLPVSYRVSTTENRCENCLAFDPSTSICSKWAAKVRPEYVCDAWTPKM